MENNKTKRNRRNKKQEKRKREVESVAFTFHGLTPPQALKVLKEGIITLMKSRRQIIELGAKARIEFKDKSTEEMNFYDALLNFPELAAETIEILSEKVSGGAK